MKDRMHAEIESHLQPIRNGESYGASFGRWEATCEPGLLERGDFSRSTFGHSTMRSHQVMSESSGQCAMRSHQVMSESSGQCAMRSHQLMSESSGQCAMRSHPGMSESPRVDLSASADLRQLHHVTAQLHRPSRPGRCTLLIGAMLLMVVRAWAAVEFIPTSLHPPPVQREFRGVW